MLVSSRSKKKVQKLQGANPIQNDRNHQEHREHRARAHTAMRTTQHLTKKDSDNIYIRGIDGSGNRWGTQLQTINITRQSRLNTRQKGSKLPR